MSKKYHKSEGGLFPNGYKTSDKHPDHNGKVEITDDMLRTLMAQRKAGQTPVIKLAGWNRTAKNTGQAYMYVSAETVEEDANEAQAPAPAPAPAPESTVPVPWE
tara:strand:+ start:221 stop:532 length:312 start_codon:yes stop_codon:yes gene_type:complete